MLVSMSVEQIKNTIPDSCLTRAGSSKWLLTWQDDRLYGVVLDVIDSGVKVSKPAGIYTDGSATIGAL